MAEARYASTSVGRAEPVRGYARRSYLMQIKVQQKRALTRLARAVVSRTPFPHDYSASVCRYPCILDEPSLVRAKHAGSAATQKPEASSS